jgi:hypothetical protein
MTGANISLTDNQTLGTNNGLSVQVDGAQTISTASGNITIKITGTATAFGTFNIPISLAGANCNVSVTVAQGAGTIGSFTNCTTVASSVSITQGTPVNATGLSLAYTGKTGQNISLTNNQLLGSLSGLSVRVNGAQTISAASGNITISVSGTATTSGTINIPINLAGASCNVRVVVTALPGTVTSLTCGSVSFSSVPAGSVITNQIRTIPYTKTGGNVTLTNNQLLGTGGGLTVRVNGAQTLTAASGTISIVLSGTPTVSPTATIPLSLGSGSCNVTVPVSVPFYGRSTNACSNGGFCTCPSGTTKVGYAEATALDKQVWITYHSTIPWHASSTATFDPTTLYEWNGSAWTSYQTSNLLTYVLCRPN